LARKLHDYKMYYNSHRVHRHGAASGLTAI
jgi:hypothetical protein